MVHVLYIDHPEARRVVEHLRSTRGIAEPTAWAPFGTRPETLRSNLRPVPDVPFVVINGSGRFHHETYAILEGLCRRRRCGYVHIDAHPDKDTYFRWKIDCASFVGAILEIPQVVEGVLLGLSVLPETEDLPGMVLGNDLHYYRFDYFAKLRQYHARPSDVKEIHFRYTRADGVRARRNPSVRSARVERLPKNKRKAARGLAVRWQDLSAFDPDALACEQIYLSVDLDVLRSGVVTDWRRKGPQRVIADNHGAMTLVQLRALIRRLARRREVLGADLCGLTRDLDRLDPARRERSLEVTAAVYDALVEAVAGSRQRRSGGARGARSPVRGGSGFTPP